MSIYESATPHADGYRDLAPTKLATSPEPARLVDVREPDEYVGELGHIAGAQLVPLATLAASARVWAREEDIVLICRSGRRSARAATDLVSMGFTRVMNLDGGMLAWQAGDLPVVRM